MTRHKTLAFRQEQVGAIRRGEKTQTRRPIRFSKVAGGRVMRPCPWPVGELCELVVVSEQRVAWSDLSYAERVGYPHGPYEYVYRQKEEPAGWFVRVTGHRTEALIDVSEDDLIAEGYADDHEGFIEFMQANYGGHVDTVWVVEFELDNDVHWMPARQQGYRQPEQYTLSSREAIDDTLSEGVDASTLASFAEHNRAKDTLRRLESRAGRLEGKSELEEQLGEVRRLAREGGIDIRSTERLIQRKINEIKAKLREAA